MLAGASGSSGVVYADCGQVHANAAGSFLGIFGDCFQVCVVAAGSAIGGCGRGAGACASVVSGVTKSAVMVVADPGVVVPVAAEVAYSARPGARELCVGVAGCLDLEAPAGVAFGVSCSAACGLAVFELSFDGAIFSAGIVCVQAGAVGVEDFAVEVFPCDLVLVAVGVGCAAWSWLSA